MTEKEIKKFVVGQIIAMLDNNILAECGTEPFTGWLEDGAVFIYAGMSEEDADRAMEYVRKVQDAVDTISFALDIFEW